MRLADHKPKINAMKKIIGLTGKYCAGKNQAAVVLEQRGFSVLDLDLLGHLALETEKEAITAKFGSSIIDSDGRINRRLLGKIVFNNPLKLAELEAIVHPAVNLMTEQWISGQTKDCVLNAAVLHKSSFFNKLDFIILIEAPFFTRLSRAKRRDKLSLCNLLKRFASQKGYTPQYLSGKAEIYRVENSGFLINPGSSIKLRQRAAKFEEKIDEILKIKGIKG